MGKHTNINYLIDLKLSSNVRSLNLVGIIIIVLATHCRFIIFLWNFIRTPFFWLKLKFMISKRIYTVVQYFKIVCNTCGS